MNILWAIMRNNLCPHFGSANGLEVLRESHTETPPALSMHLQQNSPPQPAICHSKCVRYLLLLNSLSPSPGLQTTSTVSYLRVRNLGTAGWVSCSGSLIQDFQGVIPAAVISRQDRDRMASRLRGGPGQASDKALPSSSMPWGCRPAQVLTGCGMETTLPSHTPFSTTGQLASPRGRSPSE